MTHMLVEPDLMAEIEAVRMDMQREMWEDPEKVVLVDGVYAQALENYNGERSGIIALIAALTLAIEKRDKGD